MENHVKYYKGISSGTGDKVNKSGTSLDVISGQVSLTVVHDINTFSSPITSYEFDDR